jgi:hypothetical protein
MILMVLGWFYVFKSLQVTQTIKLREIIIWPLGLVPVNRHGKIIL